MPVGVSFTANFERNLEAIERFLLDAEAPLVFDTLLDRLMNTVIPNLERFPDIGRPFLDRPARSVEVRNGLDALQRKLTAIGEGGVLCEYVLPDFLLLYARFDATIYLLSIRHHRQLSFDFESLWQS
ncbi:MAG: type II toxin-antitoxin system RelE/ParE family toxin [Candidatus Accumulibacter meliphilus]|uniref:type II toxin-antitoxin system RelE/ParE family toxin n=1 Tax=Candidatus Accumulibacter meliphilus TaxID=2211374 RepID=UPI002FC2B3DE